MVFLIALPLCLGIALASGFPPIAGVLTAIIGGLLCSHLGSAPLTIKGPAAGLIVISLGAVTELGMGDPVAGYHRALAVGVVAAIFQIVFAIVRADRLASVMPPSVLHGMLAAIGVIIIAKQVPVLLGVQGAHGEPLEMLAHIPHYVAEANPAILLIGAVSVLLLFGLPRIPGVNKLPAPLLVLFFAVPAGLALGIPDGAAGTLGGREYAVNASYLVQLPGSLIDAIAFPDFSMITSPISMKYIAMYSLVGSVESLLSALAVDALDPERRASDLRKDLLITGVGNLACASLGGLPMISEIVRSKANIDAGATSPWSNFFHGAFLLIFVALAPGLLQLIPLAALAAMLVVIGMRLASPSEFKHTLEIGWDQLALFVTTLLVTLATDLLVGVAAGLALKLVLHVARGRDLAGLLRQPARITQSGAILLVQATGPLAFTNLMVLEAELKRHVTPEIHQVRIDLSGAKMVDHTTLERLNGIAGEWSDATLEFVGLEEFEASSLHPTSFRRHR
ncbi:MAG: SulP family inorganic anion transporter [Alphaproteobacteria bacterium]|nr:SulP family inorganic anion transporter [Alphaproteobacteria bacterium]